MTETTNEVLERKISRRGFLVFITAGAAAFGILLLKRIDVESAIQDFFGLPSGQRSLISEELRKLHNADLVLFRQTTIYFSFYRMNLNHLARRFQQPVVTHWSATLFAHRSLAWPYLKYPVVDDSSICSGLIRQDT
jgi:hypothetical protein